MDTLINSNMTSPKSTSTYFIVTAQFLVMKIILKSPTCMQMLFRVKQLQSFCLAVDMAQNYQEQNKAPLILFDVLILCHIQRHKS